MIGLQMTELNDFHPAKTKFMYFFASIIKSDTEIWQENNISKVIHLDKC